MEVNYVDIGEIVSQINSIEVKFVFNRKLPPTSMEVVTRQYKWRQCRYKPIDEMNGSYVRSESRYFCRSRWKLLGALEIVEADGSLWKLVEVLEVGGLIRKLTKVQETRGSRWKSIYQRLYGSYSNSNRSGCGSFS